MRKNAFKIKLMMSVGSILLCTSELSVAMEERLFNHELTQRCGQHMEHVNDAIGAQSALNFLSTWVSSANPTIKQRTLQAAEALIEKWELDPPSWFSAIQPQAQATTEQIYREVSSHIPDEPSELTEVKNELKDVIEAEIIHAKMQEKEGILPTILPEKLVEKLLEERQIPQAKVQEQGGEDQEKEGMLPEPLIEKLLESQQIPQAEAQERGGLEEEVRRKHEAAMEAERERIQREQARRELNEKIEKEKQVEKEEQARRDQKAKAKIGELLEKKREQAERQHEVKEDKGSEDK